jgi:hypothetical protein
MSDIVASTTLVCVNSQGERREVVVEIGLPYQTPRGSWACPVAMRGMYSSLADIHGEDSLQSLCLAASLVRTLLSSVVKEGGKIFFPDSDSEYDLDVVFGQVGREASSGPA